MRRLLLLFQIAAGLSDTTTGLLLIVAPAWTLGLMRVHALPAPLAFAGFVGAFVLPVGVSYLWIAAKWPLSAANSSVWATQWRITALIRTLIAVFLAAQLVTGRMELAWMSVAVTDGALASIQWFGLTQGWLTRAD